MPDAVVLLSADPGALYDRRQSGQGFRPAEYGMHAGYPRLDRASFVDYQAKSLEQLRRFAHEQQWPVLELDPAASVADHIAVLDPLITSLRAPTGPDGGARAAGFPFPDTQLTGGR
jgi:hypothetical protein